ncbi:MAG: hypothetical protein KAV00_13415, partial [Phycisphaerae bacterium]|nr:hypothetical protein [Phycisphaerae bacterium]
YYWLTLMCQRNTFARMGVPLRQPKDWDELYRMARRVTRLPENEPDAKPNEIRTHGLYLPPSGWYLLQYIWSSGGEVVQAYYEKDNNQLIPVPAPPADYRKWHIQVSNAERYYRQIQKTRADLLHKGVNPDYSMADLKWRLVTDDTAGVEALKFYRKLLHNRWIRCRNKHENREYDLTPKMLKSGKAVCPVCGRVVDITTREGRRRIYHGVGQVGQQARRVRALNWEYGMYMSTLEEAPWSVDAKNLVPLAFPSREKDIPPAAFIAGGYLAINATQKDPRIRDAAWKYIKFVTGLEARRIRVETYVEHGLEEFVRPSSLKALGYDVELAGIPLERRKLWDTLERYARVEPYCPGFTHVMTRELGIPVEAMATDKPDMNNQYSRDPKKIMEATCRRVNSLILGELPEEVIRRRSKIGWVVAAVVVGVLVLGVLTTIRLAIRMHRKAASLEGFGIQNKTVKRTLIVAVFLAPAICSVVLWGYYPLLRGTAIAFHDYRILGGSKFVGLRNFIETVSSPDFWRYMLHTFEYLFLTLAMGFFAPIILAILLTEVPKGKILYRTIYYLPAVTTGIVTLFMWKQLLYDGTPNGLINRIILMFNDQPAGVMIVLKGLIVAGAVLLIFGLIRMVLSRGVTGWSRIVLLIFALSVSGYLAFRSVGIVQDGGSLTSLAEWFVLPWNVNPHGFLKDRDMAMFWIVVPTVWAGMGPGCLIYLAALKGIPEEQYEAASLDGAGVWTKVVHVVFPNLSALIVIHFVGAVVGGMRASQNVFVMTGGGPEDATMTVGLSIWFNAYMFLDFGLATAQAWILGAMLIGFTLYQLRLLNRMQFRTAASGKAAK